MAKKAILYDLDNTLYTVAAIGNKLFASLFELLEQEGIPAERMPVIKDAIMRKPFQVVAQQHQFSNELTQKGLELLKRLTYNEPIELHDDYDEIKKLPQERFLVTTGFTELQYSKIRSLGIEQDFLEVHVIDPVNTSHTKKTVFADILQRHHYAPSDVLVVGDDPESELKAASELGIDTVLYDRQNRYPSFHTTHKITHFAALSRFL